MGNKSEVNVALVADIKTLNEVVVTGYGAQSKRDITGAIATVSTRELLSVPATNVAQALQGHVAGVSVGNENSPGGGVIVRIRGFGTLNDNSPLYIIDGVPTKGNLNTINQNDIESLQVLKDAAAASQYGARAGNGVVIITTKKGKAGKPKLTYDAYYGVQQRGKLLDLLNTQQYADLWWESRINSGVLVNGNPRNAQFGNGPRPVIPDYIFPDGAMNGDPRVDPANYSTDIDAADFRRSKWLITKANKEGTNWMEEIFNPAPIQNHQLGVSGGTEGGRYAISLNYFNQEGIMKYTGYKRYSARANTEFNINKRVRIGENIQVAYAERIGGPFSTRGIASNQSESNAVSFAYRMQPIVPVYDIAGNFAGTKGGDLDNARNPVSDLYRNRTNINKEIRLFGNAYAEVDLAKNLTARTSFGIDYNLFNVRVYTPRDFESSESAGTNQLQTRNDYEGTWTWTNTLNYKTTLFDKLRLSAILGTESIRNYYEFVNAVRSRFASDDINNQYLAAGNAGTQTNDGSATYWRLASEFAVANLSFDEKYLLSGTLRRDRSSRFAPDFRIAYFPAVSAGWRISEENFLKNTASGWLSDLKLRASWGQTGNQEIGNFNPYTFYGTSPANSFYDLNGSRTSALQGYDLFQFGNAQAKWETTTQTDFGFDASLLKGKVDVNFDWFNRVTTDALFPVELPFTAGNATNPFRNIASFRNRGVELNLSYNGKALNNELTYTLSGNISTYRNTVLTTNGDPNTQYFGFATRLPAMTVTQEGYPISAFYGYTIDGINNTPEQAASGPIWRGYNNVVTYRQANGTGVVGAGTFRYRDLNGDGLITPADRGIIGSPHPDFSYGLNINVNYKNFGLQLFGQGVQGNQLFNYVRYWTDFPTFGGNRSLRMYEQSWRPGADNSNAMLPIVRAADNVSSVPSTYYLESGSYLRMRNIQLSYNLPRTLMNKMGMSAAQVYIQGQNLFTITKYTGMDPEINVRNSQGAVSGNTGTTAGQNQDRQIGVDEGLYPVARTVLVGLSLSF
ncbi:SusC/RagA family TonB-linked outer membrane protein [Spirosoma fluviale]|uniref:SusC/RagA family TonB-linked outer membrane protein n=1 Tax=Spirosoma fluviale TaxID=1597977 RepID=UPI0021CE9EE1|nr:TonB-dependent receptor [Spirosoma fluviale]